MICVSILQQFILDSYIGIVCNSIISTYTFTFFTMCLPLIISTITIRCYLNVIIRNNCCKFKYYYLKHCTRIRKTN